MALALEGLRVIDADTLEKLELMPTGHVKRQLYATPEPLDTVEAKMSGLSPEGQRKGLGENADRRYRR